MLSNAMLREWLCYGRYLITTGKCAQALARFVCGCFYVLRWRFLKRGALPEYLSVDTRALLNSPKRPFLKTIADPSLYPQLKLKKDNLVLTSAEIALATQKFKLGKDPKHWFIEFEDTEDTWSLHRFNWAFRLLIEKPSVSTAQFLFDQMASWSHTVASKKLPKVWDSYSLSERLSNWSLIIWLMHKEGLWDDSSRSEEIVSSLFDQSRQLLKRLEYYGPRLTNNHFLNNGRALYLFGSIFNVAAYQVLGAKILQEEYSRMFISGFLREGSSLYHLLLCRSYLEVLWLARATNDENTAKNLKGIVYEMVEASKFFFFSYDQNIPLYGDTAPDFPERWFSGITLVGKRLLEGRLPEALLAKPAWHTYWLGESQQQTRTNDFNGLPAKHYVYPKAGWHRFYKGDWTLVMYAAPKGYVGHGDHGHADLGSFELRWKGRPLLVDTGRSLYTNSFGSHYYRCGRAHNTLLVDDADPMLVNRHNALPVLMLDDYLDARPRLSLKENGQTLFAELRHSGYRRLSKVNDISRSFQIEANKLHMKDMVEGTGTHILETLFHFHPSIQVYKLAPGKLKISFNGNGQILFHYDEKMDPYLRWLTAEEKPFPGGWFSSSYGNHAPTVTLSFRWRGSLPREVDYWLESPRS